MKLTAWPMKIAAAEVRVRRGGDRMKLRLTRLVVAVSVLALWVMVLGAGAKLK
jgi:hypothetical protein